MENSAFFFFFQLSQEFVFLQQPLITSQIIFSIHQERIKLKCFIEVVLLEQCRRKFLLHALFLVLDLL